MYLIAAVPSHKHLFSLFLCTIQHVLLAWLAPPDSAIANPLSTPGSLSSHGYVYVFSFLTLQAAIGCPRRWRLIHLLACYPTHSPGDPPFVAVWSASSLCPHRLPSACTLAKGPLMWSPQARSLSDLVLNPLFLQSPTSSILHKPQCLGFSSSFLCADISSPALSALLCCNKQIQIPP